MRILLLFLSLIFVSSVNAADIGLGTIKAIKHYDFSNNKSIKIFLDSSSTSVNEACKEGALTAATITLSKHDEGTVNRMLSMALAAHMAGKKVRLNSSLDSCEANFIAIQDSVY